ncbi:MAG: DUF5060 domain-containing protein [Bryobacterales bacterium]|nr:DUF5060 domain-containing protein [Bryobacterales bacterium]
MLALVLLSMLLAAFPALGQTGCAEVQAWSACELTFDLMAGENPAQSELRAEFRSPRHKTFLLRAFAEGQKLNIRFTPTEAGTWDYRLTSSLSRFDGKTAQVTARESDAPGFVRTANVHHFATENLKPHLWMAAALERFVTTPRADFDRAVEQYTREKFTHLRVPLDAGADLREAAERIRAITAKGLTADIVLAAIPAEAGPRAQYIGEMVSRFAAFNITWAGVPGFEAAPHGRALLKDAGVLLQKLDPYAHPRTTLAAATSAPLAGDGWMNVLSYGTVDANVGAVEHQFYQRPALNTGIQSQRDLWNATMNGQYPASGSGPAMKVWAEFMANSRYWELEPYFDVDGARAVALEGVEYIVYMEKPGLVELTVENHNYDVTWMNPATGELVPQKDYKGMHFTGEPPDKTHDWVLRVSREGRKEGMLKSYKFDSRRVPVQEVEQNPLKVPFEIAAPEGDQISLAWSAKFALKIKRDTRGTRSLLVAWTAEVALDGEGYRVAGTGREGTLTILPSIANKFPAVVSLRVLLLNANGKAYTLDKVYRLVP